MHVATKADNDLYGTGLMLDDRLAHVPGWLESLEFDVRPGIDT